MHHAVHHPDDEDGEGSEACRRLPVDDPVTDYSAATEDFHIHYVHDGSGEPGSGTISSLVSHGSIGQGASTFVAAAIAGGIAAVVPASETAAALTIGGGGGDSAEAKDLISHVIRVIPRVPLEVSLVAHSALFNYPVGGSYDVELLPSCPVCKA